MFYQKLVLYILGFGNVFVCAFALYLLGDFHYDVQTNLLIGVIYLVFMIAGFIMIACAALSRRFIRNAVFISGFFENDLDGFIRYIDPAHVMGKTPDRMRREVHFLRSLYMRGFGYTMFQGAEWVMLDSKISICECKGCGGILQKRDYFTGICPYCGRNDIHAKVLSGDRFYTISNDSVQEIRTMNYYAPASTLKLVFHTFQFAILLSFAMVLIAYVCEQIGHLNDFLYMQSQIYAGEAFSYSEVNTQTVEFIISGVLIDLSFWVATLFELTRLRGLTTAVKIARVLPGYNTPYISANQLSGALMNLTGKSCLPAIRRAISLGYLKHCSIEDDHGNLYVSLSKKIVRDMCPYCAAPINAVSGKTNFCIHCGRELIGVVETR